MASTPSMDFHLANGRAYSLGRTNAAASRLNYQFYLWKESFGFNLHPTIASSLKTPSPCIADVASGTAIWLLDLVPEIPTATFEGLDMSMAVAPPIEWLPSNIKLRQWNLHDQVPDDLVKKFDVIHLRLLILVVEKSDPSPIVRKVARMLKPGGWIQWDDYNYQGTHVVKTNPALKTPALDRLCAFLFSGGRQDWVVGLPKIFEKEGFEDTQIFHYRPRREMARANGELHLSTIEEFAARLLEDGKVEEGNELLRLVQQGLLEAAAGAAMSTPRAVSIGRKKTSSAVKL
ncbi:class I SAM-dependent methyltransferase [Aspergillus homomorphus CBS 101889]|uniref:UMTA methyltransferase family protein n=1 Tax=Aspergillus homomorphus (strain CBS 101889) TaxID=1450537 RepID=A0A395HYF0_ASPHC|nr:UMTA methyltransferase family protein [Aspergillus homomorphus CBS 101889]RAL12413.1 UMTA methyltransferase family protein [Aspergillus homomorphus CBS 101889]